MQGFTIISVWLFCLSAWLTHVVFCLSSGKYVLLLAGAIAVPIGIIHGVAIWLGAPWV